MNFESRQMKFNIRRIYGILIALVLLVMATGYAVTSNAASNKPDKIGKEKIILLPMVLSLNMAS